MDVTALLQQLRSWLPPDAAPNAEILAFAAAGVLAARNARPSRPGPLVEPSPIDPQSYPIPAVRWSDPTEWIARAKEQTGTLDAWWLTQLSVPPLSAGVRLIIDSATVGAEVPAQAMTVLADTVRAVTAEALFPRPARSRPAWTWPLRLATADGYWPEPLRERGTAPSWWTALSVPVVSEGPWAVASLALLPDDAFERLDQAAAEPVRATAVVVAADPAAPPPMYRLSQLATRHNAAVVAIVDPGPNRDSWIINLLTELSHDVPLDVALRVAFSPSTPVVVGDSMVLNRTRVRSVLVAVAARAAAREAGGPPVRDRVLRGQRLRDLIDSGNYISEVFGASDAAELLQQERAARRERPDRFLLAELSGPTESGDALLPDADYVLAVWIGTDDRRAAQGMQRFPDDELAADATAVELTVVVTELDLSPGQTRAAQQTTMTLHPLGDSEPVTFPIRTGPIGTLLELRIAVLHRQRFVQTGLLRGRVGGPVPPSFALETVVRAGTDELDLSTPHDVAIVLNRNAGGATIVTTITAEGTEIHAPHNLDAALANTKAVLDRLVNEPEAFTGYHSAAYGNLLIELARQGRALKDAMFGDRVGVAPEWRGAAAPRISVLSAHPGATLPLELIYDRHITSGLLGPKNKLCQRAPEYADLGRCPGDCSESQSAEMICPFGFWGASKVIERHVNARRQALLTKDFALAISPDVERHQVALGAVLAAASKRADHNDAQAWTTAAADLPDATLADGWRKLAELVQQRRKQGIPPAVLLLVTHVVQEVDGGIVLEIGADDRWPVLNGFEPLVRRLSAGVARLDDNPLVMVLGCGTGAGQVPMFEAPAVFLAGGAPAVVASLTTVLGRHIVPIAVRLLDELHRCAAAGGRAALLGEAMRAARQRCLLDGQGAVFALVSFGDTDWQLGLSTGSPP